MLNKLFVENKVKYTGSQLAPHWIYNNFNLKGDSIVSFIGECQVDLNSMVDLADVKNKESIYSPEMLSFIWEIFDESLELAVCRQRLFIVCIKEELEEQGIPGRLTRRGDDIYYHGIAGVRLKLTVSIATKSILSTLMHTGINILTQGTPVPAAGLHEMGIDPVAFADRVMNRFDLELDGIRAARCKVRPV